MLMESSSNTVMCAQDIEELNVAAQRKEVGTATAAYKKATADLTAFKAAI